MEPFGIALGIDNILFDAWRDVLFNHSDTIILVEGETDKEYFELLRKDIHGKNALTFSGEILPYNGCDNLKNTVLLKFITSKYKKAFITYDLDVEKEVESTIKHLGFVKDINYCSIGLTEAGKMDIEGLVPEEILQKVYAANPSLVQLAMNGNQKEKKDAKNALKKKILQEFKTSAQPNTVHYKHFYKIVGLVNKYFN